MYPDEGVLENSACRLELTCRSSHAMRASPKHTSKCVLTGVLGGYQVTPHYHMNKSHHVTITAHASHWAKCKDTGLCGH